MVMDPIAFIASVGPVSLINLWTHALSLVLVYCCVAAVALGGIELLEAN